MCIVTNTSKGAASGQAPMGEQYMPGVLVTLQVEQNYWNGPVSTIVSERVFKAWQGGVADDKVVAEKLEHLQKQVSWEEERQGGRWVIHTWRTLATEGGCTQDCLPWAMP